MTTLWIERMPTILHTLGFCKEAHLGPTTHRLSQRSSSKRRPKNSQQREEAYNACSDRFEGKNDIGMLCPQSKRHEPPAKGTSLPKLASGVPRAARLVP